MALTSSQKTTLKAYINSVPEWAALPNNSDTADLIAKELSKTAVPDFIVWRTSVPMEEMMSDGFDFTQVDNLTSGQARIWEWLFDNSSKALNASEPGKRAGISECWKGTAAKVAVATFCLGKCKRQANVIEKLLASGTGTTVAPATMSFEGTISYSDVEQARAS